MTSNDIREPTDPRDPNEPVPVLTLYEPTRAEFLKNMLEDEGIACEIEGENQGGLSGALIIRLMVRAADADRAREFLERHHE